MKYTILAADDSRTCLKTLETIFSNITDNYFLITAGNGLEACNLAFRHIPDLILMDLIMPEMNGVRAIKHLKSNNKTKHIPIILLTASEALEEAFNAGADDFIIKPFKYFELLTRVRLALSLVEKIEKIKLQNKQLQLQNNEIKKQREQLENQKKDIIDDIRYSKRIQNAILPTNIHIKSILNDYFIFNKPRNIVSGDFYWVDKKFGKIIIAVADCTGHGISGAFMTMASMAFIKEIINNYEFSSAGSILDHLRTMVIELLQQKGEEGEASDGLDIALCLLDYEKGTLQYAGANNPLYVIRNKELLEYKADRMPIGIYIDKIEHFTNNFIKIEKGDRLYMFSDGFVDQFGGPKNKKFRYKQFRQLILDMHEETMANQASILNKTFEDWKGDEYQVDDVLVMGTKL